MSILFNLAKERLSKINSQFSKLIINSGWILFSGGISALIIVLQSSILARSLGVVQFGYLAVLQSTLGIVSQFMDFRTWEVVIKYFPEKWKTKNKWSLQDLVYILLIIDILAGVIGFACYYLLSKFIAVELAHDVLLSKIIIIYGLMLPVTFISAGTFVGIMRKLDMFNVISIKSLAISILDLIGVAVLVSIGYKLKEIIILFVVVEWLNCISSLIVMYYVLIKRYGLDNMKPSHPSSAFREIKAFLIQSWISGSIKGFQSRIDIPLLGALTTPSAVGIYKLANDIASLFSRIGNPIQSAVLPILVDLNHSDEINKIRLIISQTIRLLSYILIPIIMGIIIWGEPIMIKLGGENYRGAGLPFIFLSIGGVVNIILIWSRPLLVARNRIAISNSINLIFTVLEIILIYILTIRFEVIGASFAMMIIISGAAVTMAFYSLRTLKESVL